MKRRHRGAVAAVVLAVVAALAWWFDARARPERVGPRLVAAVTGRHPGTTVAMADGGVMRVALPSGVYVDVRLPPVFDACRASRWRCSNAIDDALADIDRNEASTRAPQVAQLRPIVVAGGGGDRFGYVVDPLVGPYEVRYALVDGVASSDATGATVARLGLTRAGLRATVIANQRRDPAARLEPVDAKGAKLFRVRSLGDPVASLLDRERMAALAAGIGARKLYGVIPSRGALVLAPASDASVPALEALVEREHGRNPPSVDGGIVAYDVDAPEGQALSTAALSPALRQP